MSTRRSQLKIMLNVLELIHSGEHKASLLMSGAGITSSQLKTVKKLLSTKGYIKITKAGTRKGKRQDRRTRELYSITQKGTNVLKYYWKTGRILEEPPTVK
jgi:predicted transcriptional regulator